MPENSQAPPSKEKILDANVKKNYKLIYLKRNVRLKLRDAYAWGLEKTDIDLLMATWKEVAHAMGPAGRKRWSEIERELPLWQKQFERLNGINWIDQKAITNMNQKQQPYVLNDLFPPKKREEILNPLVSVDRIDLQ